MELFRPDNPAHLESEDRFQRYKFAKRIAEIVSAPHYPSSLVIGVYGKWGEGKTTVLNFVRKEISAETVIINFNPWLFTDEKQLIKSFFTSIATAIGKKLKNKKETALELFGEYADELGTIANLVVTGSGFIVRAGKKISYKLKKDSFEDLKQKIDTFIIEANTNFVIFIDDIDRLEKQEIQAVFKLVKLAGDFPRTSYILSFDDDLVAASIGPKYGKGDKIAGYDFLEKIIQMPLQLPKANTLALRNYTLDLLNKTLNNIQVTLTTEEANNFIQKFNDAFVPALVNPRLGVRFSNSIGFSIPLLQGEVNISDLMTIEGIKTFYPSLYHFIRNNPQYFVTNFSLFGGAGYSDRVKNKEEVKKEIDTNLEAYTTAKNKILSMLMSLFPQIKSIYSNYGYTDENFRSWYINKKICSPNYFERYFSYVVQEGEISDTYFNNLLTELTNSSIDNLDTLLINVKEVFKKVKPDSFIFKIQQHTLKLQALDSFKLSVLLAKLGNDIPNISPSGFFTGKDQASYTIRKLIENIPAEDRESVATLVLRLAIPFEYSIEILRNLSYQEGYVDDPVFLTKENLKAIANVIADRFIQDSIQINLIDTLSDETILSVFSMFHQANREETINQLLLDKLNNSSESSLQIIKFFTPTATSTSQPIPYKTDLKHENYQEMEIYIDPKLIYNKTLEAFGKQTYIEPAGRLHQLTDENLIGLFQKIHEEILTL